MILVTLLESVFIYYDTEIFICAGRAKSVMISNCGYTIIQKVYSRTVCDSTL